VSHYNKYIDIPVKYSHSMYLSLDQGDMSSSYRVPSVYRTDLKHPLLHSSSYFHCLVTSFSIINLVSFKLHS
jgi:hypothetical protein